MNDMGSLISDWIFLSLVVGIPMLGLMRGVTVYESFIEGAKGGFEIIVKIIPYFVAMIVAIGMLRASGAFDLVNRMLAPVFNAVGFPVETLPLALMRPFSGAASNAILVDTIHQYGPDSLLAKTSATIMGSTETTFYVIAVYFGAVGIKRIRHAAITGLIADAAGVIAAVVVCNWLF